MRPDRLPPPAAMNAELIQRRAVGDRMADCCFGFSASIVPPTVEQQADAAKLVEEWRGIVAVKADGRRK